MSRWLVEKTSSVLAARTSRRGMLVRSAVVGSALATNPFGYVLRPISAYAAACQCRGQACSCGTACCDGYTEFCCTMTGENRCPPGTVAAGWWRAEGSGLCGGGSRYYMDCNIVPGQGSCGCQCAGDDCNNRVTCCVDFRYGQCHQELADVGPILCRVVTCTPPWQFDPSCTTTDARDDATAHHDAPCLHGPTPAPGTLVTTEWFLRNTATSGSADITFRYGAPGDVPIVGDWDGDGVATPGVVRNGTFYLRNSNTGGVADITFRYGDPGDAVIVGDWDGDGTETIGIVRGNRFYLRNSNTGGVADVTFSYGDPGDRVVVGRWKAGDKRDSVGVVRGNTLYLRNPDTGLADIVFSYGDPGDLIVMGDWDADGVDTPCIVRNGKWYVRNTNTSGLADSVFSYGDPGDIALAGRWRAPTGGGLLGGTPVPVPSGPGVAR